MRSSRIRSSRDRRWGHRRRIILFAARVLSGYDATDVPRCCEREADVSRLNIQHTHMQVISLSPVFSHCLYIVMLGWLSHLIYIENNTTHIKIHSCDNMYFSRAAAAAAFASAAADPKYNSRANARPLLALSYSSIIRDAFRLLHSVCSSESAPIAVFSSLQLNLGFSSWAGADDEKSLCVLCFGRLWVLRRQRCALMVLKELLREALASAKSSALFLLLWCLFVLFISWLSNCLY